MASSLRPTNVNKINASRYGKLTLVRNAAVGSLLPKEVHSKMRRLRGLTFAFALCASASSLFAPGGIIGTDRGQGASGTEGAVDGAKTIHGKLSAVRDLIDMTTQDTVVARIEAVMGNTNSTEASEHTFGIIGSDSGDQDGTVNSTGSILEKLTAVRNLLDTDNTATPDLVKGVQTIMGNLNYADSANYQYGLIGSDRGDQDGAVNSEAGMVGKLTAVVALIDDNTPANDILEGIQKIAGNKRYADSANYKYGIIGSDDGTGGSTAKEETDIFGKLVALKVIVDGDSSYDDTTDPPNTITRSVTNILGNPNSDPITYGLIGKGAGTEISGTTGVVAKMTKLMDTIAPASERTEDSIAGAIEAIMGTIEPLP